jgi:hypothetical protein
MTLISVSPDHLAHDQALVAIQNDLLDPPKVPVKTAFERRLHSRPAARHRACLTGGPDRAR